MTSRNTISLEPFVEQPEPAADLRLFRVGATDSDTSFYVRCADLSMAVEIVVERAFLKQLPIEYRPIVEVTGG